MKYSLPDSARDLLIKDGQHLMRSLSLYEIFRRFGHILRLSPFRYEDFTAALLADDQSVLLAEVHIQLLKALIRDDRAQATWLGPPDIKDSVNLYLQLVDHSNWPAALRIYLSADPYSNAFALDHLDCESEDSRCYPYGVDLETRLSLLEQLCDQFLMTNIVREEIVNGRGALDKPETTCRLCSKANGDLIHCSSCPAIYHLRCSDPPLENYPDVENGDETYLCALCRANQLRGVTDCINDDEKSGNLKRHEALGMDKLGRRYWFLVRRLFVVDDAEDDVRYYTTLGQFQEILEGLNENRHETSLIENLTSLQDEIERQMRITENLYATLLHDQRQEDGTYSLALGQDGTHRNYTNHYSSASSSSGKSSIQDRDITRSLNNKFCLTSPLRWFGAINGHLNTITLTVRTTILKFESMLPQTFIHPCWQNKRTKWIKTVNNAHKPTDFCIALTQLERCIKPVLFKGAWYDNVGFVQLIRSTFNEREELKKIDRQPRGFERNERVAADFELSERLGTMVKFSSKLKPVKHQVWKQKGEEYRLTGLNGWYWRAITHQPRSVKAPKIYRIEPSRMVVDTDRDDSSAVTGILEVILQSVVDVIDVAANLSLEDTSERYMYPKKPVIEKSRESRISKMEGLLARRLKLIEMKKAEEAERSLQQSKANTEESVQNKLMNGFSTPVKTTISTNAAAPGLCPTIVNSPSGNQKVCYTNKIGGNIFPAGDNKKIQSKLAKPKLPPYHDFMTKRGRVRSLLVLPELDLRRLARSGGLKEARTFNYSAKPNYYIWPYGMTPRPTLRTCWLYRNQLVPSIQDVSLQLKVLHACIRWDDLSTKPPQSGRSVVQTDDSTITVELLKKRDWLPYLLHSEYLIRKTTVPLEQPTKYRKTSVKKSSTPSGRSGLRARRPVEQEEEKKPTKEEVWVSEYQLELWELKLFDERLERQRALMRERALREEAEKRRRIEAERLRSIEQERRKLKAEQDEASKRLRLSTPIMSYQRSSTPTTPNNASIRPTSNNGTATTGSQPTATTPVLRYFRTEQGQIIRLPASYLQRGTPLILRHVTPGTNQTNTYIIRPQSTTSLSSPNMNNVGLRLVAPGSVTSSPMMVTQRGTAPAATLTSQTIVKTIPTTVTANILVSATPTVSQVTTSTTQSSSTPASQATNETSSTASVPASVQTSASSNEPPVPSTNGTQGAEIEQAPKPNGVTDAGPTAAPSQPAHEKLEQGMIEETTKQPPFRELSPIMQNLNGISSSTSGNQPTMASSDYNECATGTTTSVGTVANEMAHDRHAPSNAALEPQAISAQKQPTQQQHQAPGNQVQ